MLYSAPTALRSLACAALLVQQSFAAPTLNTRAVIPALDPFYTPPAGYAETAPGTILRNRTIDASFFGLIPDDVEGYQLLYRTTAINGTAIATVTTIFKPTGADLDRFVSFSTAYDSSNTICDPSYNYQLGAVQTDVISAVEMLLLQAYLLEGYIVASADYEGPDAAFAASHLEGMASLDGIRAVNNFYETLGLTTDTPMVVGTGYSGGAIATGWAAALQPTYAPELNVVGWSAGGTPANLTGTTVFVDGTVFAGFLPAAIDGLAKPSAYGAELNPLLDSVLTAYGKEVVANADTYCAVEDILDFADMSVLSTAVQSEGYDFLYNPTVVDVLAQCILGVNSTETPTKPVFLYHGLQDEIIPYANASTLYKNWCADGASVQFTTYGNGGHLTTEILGITLAVPFAESAFAGTLSSGCSMTTVLNSTLDPIALGVELEPVLVHLLDLLAVLGEADENVISDLSTLEDQETF